MGLQTVTVESEESEGPAGWPLPHQQEVHDDDDDDDDDDYDDEAELERRRREFAFVSDIDAPSTDVASDATTVSCRADATTKVSPFAAPGRSTSPLATVTVVPTPLGTSDVPALPTT